MADSMRKSTKQVLYANKYDATSQCRLGTLLKSLCHYKLYALNGFVVLLYRFIFDVSVNKCAFSWTRGPETAMSSTKGNNSMPHRFYDVREWECELLPEASSRVEGYQVMRGVYSCVVMESVVGSIHKHHVAEAR